TPTPFSGIGEMGAVRRAVDPRRRVEGRYRRSRFRATRPQHSLHAEDGAGRGLDYFIEASRAKLKDMMESRLDTLRLCALLVDATPFEGQQMVAALGIGQDGRKTILG